MSFKVGFALAALLAATPIAPANAQTAGEPLGVWLTQKGDARVRISKCGPAICGSVIWLRDAIDPSTGRAPVDNLNPNPSLQSRPIIGIQLFQNMHQVGDYRWSGQIYNADDGGTYASNIGQTGPDSLKVEGCVGAFCGHEMWQRVGK